MAIALPATLVQGETLNYTASVADYPASDGWVLTLYLNPRAGGTVRNVVGVADGERYLLQASAATTATWATGHYAWEIVMTLGSERYCAENGQLKVLPGLAVAAAGTDTRTDEEVALDAVRAVINGTATQGVQSYRINGRELSRYSIAELLALHSHLVTQVMHQQQESAISAGRPSRRKVYVRMGRA